MLNLPLGYSFEHFQECSDFILEVFDRKETAEEENPLKTVYVNCEYDPDLATDFESLEHEHGVSVAYFYEIALKAKLMSLCAYVFDDVISFCDARSSDVAELHYVCHVNNPPKDQILIGVTAHSLVADYLESFRNSIINYCWDKNIDAPSVAMIKQNLEILKKKSSLMQFENDDVSRILCRVRREYAIVAGRHLETNSPKMVTASRIADIVQKERKRSDPYSAPWISNHTREWPEPDIEHSGSSPRKWQFDRLKSVLKSQFSDIDWDKF
ncbi:hypothetical protein [Gimesia panareensis]|uniref:hypothetical protein n=1 Tax=Gimesia panareensis TaxID=2527978 RepID=UPI00118BBF9A|nr:hypothetical protein [Gimesia panareensis]QDU50872.1 hypothetical protein Pan110_32330 [Gimesia panareensis]